MDSNTIRPAWMLLALLAACGGGGSSGASVPNPAPTATPTATPTPGPFQPLAVGDQWTYACGLRGQPSNFLITNSIAGMQTVNGQATYAFALQIPSSPTQSVTQTMLLANDPSGNLNLYGYLVNGTVRAIASTQIVAAAPVALQAYNYPAPNGTTVSRTFESFTSSNVTPFAGVYPRVAVYYESNATHNYGYVSGVGIVEEDHGPNFQYDCLLSGLTLH